MTDFPAEKKKYSELQNLKSELEIKINPYKIPQKHEK